MGWESEDLGSTAASGISVVGPQKCHFNSLSQGFLTWEGETSGPMWVLLGRRKRT